MMMLLYVCLILFYLGRTTEASQNHSSNPSVAELEVSATLLKDIPFTISLHLDWKLLSDTVDPTIYYSIELAGDVTTGSYASVDEYVIQPLTLTKTNYQSTHFPSNLFMHIYILCI